MHLTSSSKRHFFPDLAISNRYTPIRPISSNIVGMKEVRNIKGIRFCPDDALLKEIHLWSVIAHHGLARPEVAASIFYISGLPVPGRAGENE
jgi:hypothetical protein